jgi:hypothetical protein
VEFKAELIVNSLSVLVSDKRFQRNRPYGHRCDASDCVLHSFYNENVSVVLTVCFFPQLVTKGPLAVSNCERA